MATQATSGVKRRIVLTLLVVAAVGAVMATSRWALSAGLIFACGVYVAFEFALVKTSLRHLERDVEAGEPGSAAVLAMKQQMNSMLAACQFGITLTSLGVTLALEPALHHALRGHAALAEHSAALAVALGAFFHVTFGELVPKGLALVVPRQVLYATAPFMQLFRYPAIPFIKTCNAIANAVVRALTGKDPDTDAHHDEGMEVGEALLAAHASGRIHQREFKWMRNVLAFGDRTAREIMTPAKDVVALDLQKPWAENLARIDEHLYSRYPVVDGDWFKVVGYVRATNVLRAEAKQQRDLKALVLPIERRPETVKLSQLNLFAGAPLVALYDEHDSFVGLLTAEDVVEQVVGEIYDETDDRAGPSIEPLGEGAYRIDGAVLLADARDALGLAASEAHQGVDTIGGLVVTLLGRQPRDGDRVELGRYAAMVESARGFQVGKLRFEPLARTPTPTPPPAAPPEASSPPENTGP